MTHYVFLDMKGYVLSEREREKERGRERESRRGKWYYRKGFVVLISYNFLVF